MMVGKLWVITHYSILFICSIYLSFLISYLSAIVIVPMILFSFWIVREFANGNENGPMVPSDASVCVLFTCVCSFLIVQIV